VVRAAVEGRLPRGIGVERLRDAPAEWSQQFEALGLNPRCTAGAVALSLAYIAHYDFGLSRQEIRTPAVVAAAVIAVLVAVELFGAKLRKPK
jgi:hypothetical protein